MLFTSDFLASLVGGTLVEFNMGEGRDGGEFGRAKITEAKLIENGRKVSLLTDGPVLYEGDLDLVFNVSESNGITYFSTSYLDIDMAVAPPGIEIPVVA